MQKKLRQVGFIWKDLHLQAWQLFLLLSHMFFILKFWNYLILSVDFN